LAKKGTARGKRPKKAHGGAGVKTKVMYCEKCGTTDHKMVREIGRCHGGAFVVEGRDWRWIRA
jgi:hypothetical protein